MPSPGWSGTSFLLPQSAGWARGIGFSSKRMPGLQFQHVVPMSDILAERDRFTALGVRCARSSRRRPSPRCGMPPASHTVETSLLVRVKTGRAGSFYSAWCQMHDPLCGTPASSSSCSPHPPLCDLSATVPQERPENGRELHWTNPCGPFRLKMLSGRRPSSPHFRVHGARTGCRMLPKRYPKYRTLSHLQCCLDSKQYSVGAGENTAMPSSYSVSEQRALP